MTPSDVRAKQKITEAPSSWELIKGIDVKKYQMNLDVENDGKDAVFHTGVIADDLLKNPETESMIHTWEGESQLAKDADGAYINDLKTVNYGALQMQGLVALKEAQARIEALEKMVAELIGNSKKHGAT